MAYNAIEISYCAAFMHLLSPEGYLQKMQQDPSNAKYTDAVQKDQSYLWKTITYLCANEHKTKACRPIIYRLSCGFQKTFLSMHFSGQEIADVVLKRNFSSPVFDEVKTGHMDFVEQANQSIHYLKTHFTGNTTGSLNSFLHNMHLTKHIFDDLGNTTSEQEKNHILHLGCNADKIRQNFRIMNSLLLPNSPAQPKPPSPPAE